MNRTRKPESLTFLLQKNKLQHSATLIASLDSLLQSYLKQHNISGCRIGNLQNNNLIIEIPDATWQLRLQFFSSELLSLLRQQVPALLNIKIKVNPRLKENKEKQANKAEKNVKRASRMPEDIAQSFLALAENADPQLQKALRSLAEYKK